ncbi:MAG: TonB-dependent receptor [Chitinophagaceae bacterium]
MKKLMLGMLMLLSQQILNAQYKLSGTVLDKASRIPVANATVELKGVAVTQTSGAGTFTFSVTQKGSYWLKVSFVGWKTWEQKVELNDKIQTISITIEEQALFLQPVEVMAIRAGDRMPFAKTNLGKADIAKMNTGVDLPFIVNQTPSVIINSDAGNGIGYTGIRIRGTDATRINMTLNGIPYNDAESQGIFFVNLPDFSSSVNSIQIQRGVGTSSNGAGAFGATLNLSTNEFQEKPYAELNTGFGSFNTQRYTLKGGTGLLNNHFTIDARASFIGSDGFIDRGSSDLQSAYGSIAYYSKKTSIRFNAFTGKEKTFQAWNGIPEAKLKGDAAALETHYWNNVGYLYNTREDSVNLFNSSNNRTYNYFLYQNQTDNYQQNHYQLFFNHQLNKDWTLNAALFLTRGKGYYEEYKTKASVSDYGFDDFVVGGETITEADLIRQLWLDNYFYGTTFSAQYKKDKNQFTFGGAYTQYDGKHYGKITWSEAPIPKEYKWYDLTADKSDLNLYAKYQRRITTRWEAFADVQYRTVNHTINGFRKTPDLKLNNNFNFVNPKLGISYADTKGWLGFASFSIGNKEPNREDFEAGVSQQPKHETLYDFEINIERRQSKYSWAATGYYMYYHNQLVLTGRINDVGAYTRTNIPKSYRTGIELQGTVQPVKWFNAAANLTLSSNRLLKFTEYVDDYDNGGQKENYFASSPISFSPAVVSGFTLNFVPFKQTELSLLNKYVSRQYLDNTGNKSRSIDPYFVSDLRIFYQLKTKMAKEFNLFLQINNVLDVKYEANGYTYNYIYGGQTIVENFYYPMAGRNLMAGLTIKL